MTEQLRQAGGTAGCSSSSDGGVGKGVRSVLGRSDGHIRELYLVDESGKRIAVVLPIEEYERLLEALEELDDIRAYQEAIESGEEAISVDNFIAEIENDQQRAMSSASCAGRGRRSSGYRLLGAKDCTPAGGHPAD